VNEGECGLNFYAVESSGGERQQVLAGNGVLLWAETWD